MIERCTGGFPRRIDPGGRSLQEAYRCNSIFKISAGPGRSSGTQDILNKRTSCHQIKSHHWLRFWPPVTSAWSVSRPTGYAGGRTGPGAFPCRPSLIFAFWHNRFIMMPYCYRHHFRKKRIAVIVSQSRDGELVGKFLDRYRFKSIRGSSSRGGRKAMLALLRLLKEDLDAAIAADGPRGPTLPGPGRHYHPGLDGRPSVVPASYRSSLPDCFSEKLGPFPSPPARNPN